MTVDELVNYFTEGEGADVLRESQVWVCQQLAIPKLRRGSYFPSFLEPHRRSEQALVSVVQGAYVAGVSDAQGRPVVESLGLRISKSEVSRICQGLDEQVEAFRRRPLEGRYPPKVRREPSRPGRTSDLSSSRRDGDSC